MASDVTFLRSAEYVSAVLKQIESADTRFYASMFIIDSRFMTDEYYQVRGILQSLRGAIDRGVDVKVLVGLSDVLTIRASNFAAVRLLAIYGIPVGVYPSDTETHAKYVIIDGRTVILGSHNWAALSFSRATEDSVLMKSTQVAEELYQAFMLAWTRAEHLDFSLPGFPQQALGARTPLHLSESTGSGKSRADCRLLLDGQYLPVVDELIRGTSSAVDVAMFLMSASEAGVGPKILIDRLIARSKAGVAVRVLLDQDRKGQEFKSRLVNGPTARRLIKEGVQVRFDQPDRLLHSKLIILDQRMTVLGSHNWTVPSLTRYNEASVLLDSEGAARKSHERFEVLWKTAVLP